MQYNYVFPVSNITLLKYLFTLGGTAGKATPSISNFAPALPHTGQKWAAPEPEWGLRVEMLLGCLI
jgi:hypothetical protein